MKLSIGGILLQRCPRCLKGRVFHGLAGMNRECPACGLVFEREPGYFTGAMYASYFFGMATSMPVWMTMLLVGVNPILIVAEAAIQLALTGPFLWVYSRVAWLHIDNLFNPFPPRETTAAE